MTATERKLNTPDGRIWASWARISDRKTAYGMYLAAKRDRDMRDKIAALHARAGLAEGATFGHLLAWRPAYDSARPNQAEFFVDRGDAEARLAELEKNNPNVLAALSDSRNQNRQRSAGAGAHGVLAACDLLVTSLGNTLCAMVDTQPLPLPGVIVRGGFQPAGKRPKSATKTGAANKKASAVPPPPPPPPTEPAAPAPAPEPVPAPAQAGGGGDDHDDDDLQRKLVIVATPEEAAQKQMDLLAAPKEPKSATKVGSVAGQRRTSAKKAKVKARKKRRAHTAKKADRAWQPPPAAPTTPLFGAQTPARRAASAMRLMESAIAGRISGMSGMALNGIEGRVTRLLAENSTHVAYAQLSVVELHRLRQTLRRYGTWRAERLARNQGRNRRRRYQPPPANQE